jgi:glutamyl-tRNA synthetase
VVVTRFAPSPTGELHLGGAWTALASWVVARRARGRFVVRMEDLDAPRTVKGAAEQILHDLRWLGLDWDEGPDIGGPSAPYVQSARNVFYERALDVLRDKGLLYPCDCSRAEIGRVASAPHTGDDVVYPGLCRDLDPTRAMKRPPAWRVRVGSRVVHFVDDICGARTERLDFAVGDFVLKRADGLYAYQLAVVVDDAAMGITHLIRGDDLLSSTARQVFLFDALSLAVPRLLHVPLVVGDDGRRLAKRNHENTISGLQEAGVSARAIVGKLAFGLGLAASDAPQSPTDIVEEARSPTWPHEPWRMPKDWCAR